ncbi:ATP-binding protein [Mucilaginibacter sp. JRF]|uniref:AAA family ATPase n=1 Tax=Mucilaginibacter sp. JRF TaxID=2780088 RepID=UPI00187E238C|nr:ATP-binding protein [Mucilaginibacter sp. JRF]MBE9586904.1 ATP-binding protein [Mucilaginibacter sp. JRF]
MDNNIIKIAVVGPESTGKSTMSAYLAEHYHTIWVPEYAREYCENLNREYTWQDELNMFHGQLELEEKLAPQANKLLICDTTFITIKIWSDHLFGKSPQEVLDKLADHPYDLYLLLDIDMPWQDDPLRDFPHLRGHFMDIWHRELQALNADYKVISGLGAGRYAHAVQAIDAWLQSRDEKII